MNIQTSKIELVKMILNIENDKFIDKITKFIQKEKGIKELNKGKRVEFSDFLVTTQQG